MFYTNKNSFKLLSPTALQALNVREIHNCKFSVFRTSAERIDFFKKSFPVLGQKAKELKQHE